MPYRRLPTTDQARLRAMEKAYKIFQSEGAGTLAYSEASLVNIRNVLPRFQNSVMNFNANKETQALRSHDYLELARKSRMYLSHYIQVLKMGILRGELKPNIREYYGLSSSKNGLPKLTSDADLLKWGKKIIEGDQKRIMSGGNPIYNPSIALVKVNYEKFCEAYRHQKTLQANTERQQQQVASLRKEVDAIILQLWNEIEAFYATFPEKLMREKTSNYGVVYIFRKSELEKLKAAPVVQKVNKPIIVIEPQPIIHKKEHHEAGPVQSKIEF